MRLGDLPTPCLVLDRGILQRNLAAMDRAVDRLGVALRPHLKTAKSIDVARLALAGAAARRGGGITVSTLREAAYFAARGVSDILLAVAVTPGALERVATLNAAGAAITVVTDDAAVAAAIAAMPTPPRTLVEIDSGQHRAGLSPDDPALPRLARILGRACAGVMTHAGHSYAARGPQALAAIAEQERAAALRAAERLSQAGAAVQVVSIGSTPTARHAVSAQGVSEIRAGVYMFGDLFQAAIGCHDPDDLALTVLASVIGSRPAERTLLLDAGALALSMDRSTQATGQDWGYGRVLDMAGHPAFGAALVEQVWQEHGLARLDAGQTATLPVGARVRIAPNHACHTAAAHDRYFVVDGDDAVAAIWPRVNGW